MKKTAFIIMIITIVSKITGFGREISLSYFYGISNISDAYLIALTIPGTIFALVGVGIATNYIPIYSSITNECGSQLADRFTSCITNFMLLISTLIIMLGLVYTVPIVRLFASGFEGETLDLAVRITRISILGLYFSCITYIFGGYLQVKNNFNIPAMAGIPFNFVIILSIAISTKLGTNILGIGSIVAALFQFLFLLPFIYNSGYRYKFTFNIHDKYIKKMLFLSVPVIIGISVNQLNILVDRTIASQIAIGGISALTYANRLNLFIQGIFVTSIATAIYPTISKMAAAHNMNGFKSSVTEAITSINILVVPATIGSMVFSGPVVKLLFGRGAFDEHAISMTSLALFFYSIGMVAFGLREILSRAFYSLQDTKTPMINATIAMIMNIILNIILAKFLGIGGLALATSISAIFCTVLLFISLRKKIGAFGMKQISISFLKILIASAVMGLIAKLSFNYLTANIFSQNLSLIIAIGIGALTYFTTIYFMKIDDVDVIANAVKKKLTRSKAIA